MVYTGNVHGLNPAIDWAERRRFPAVLLQVALSISLSCAWKRVVGGRDESTRVALPAWIDAAAHLLLLELTTALGIASCSPFLFPTTPPRRLSRAHQRKKLWAQE